MGSTLGWMPRICCLVRTGNTRFKKAVKSTDVVVVCLSVSAASKAGFAQKEIKFALDVADLQPEGTIFIISARLEDCNVPDRLSKWHWVNLYEESGYKKLVSALIKRLAQCLGI